MTPTTDEHSIKVEGTGSAIITDITVELLPNRDIFEDIYPDSDSEKEDSDQDDDDAEEKANTALDEVKDKIQELRDDQARAEEGVASAASRLKFLDAYGKSLDKKRGVDIEVSVETYRKEREKVFGDHMTGSVRVRELAKKILDLGKEQERLEKLAYKERVKAARAKARVERAKAKLREKESRREMERLNEKNRIRKERENFWPRCCYTVRITLEGANFTPSSSRRSSIASISDVKVMTEKDTAHDDGSAYTCDLSLSYVTSAAFWSPSYDLALSTTASTAMLCFDAQLTNMTSETWSNSKVTLSTSQTTFAGLQDAIPTLAPWRVKLGGKWNGGPQNDLITSNEERQEQGAWQATQAVSTAQKPRAQLFGLTQSAQPGSSNNLQDYQMQLMLLEQQNKKRLMMAKEPVPQQMQLQLQAQQQAQQQYQSNAALLPAQHNFNVVTTHSAAPPGASFFGTNDMVQQANAESRRSALGASAAAMSSFPKAAAKSRKASQGFPAERGGGGGDAIDYEDEDEDDTILEPQPSLAFQESSFEETGLTATYDLPSLKTLKPSTTASKQRVARLAFSSVQFSHTVIAKYRPAAYLKAKLRNASKLTLLRGPTGLTLDGTFLGRSTLPRCSAGDTFSLSLGVDPAIKVAYPKPDVKRSTTGVFTKGDNSVYTRTVTLVNTRAAAGKPVTLAVLDQVPVSEDEKLRVDVQVPRGVSGGAVVTAGTPGKEGKEGEGWGKATAGMKKGGEVCWDVVLNAGKSVRLTLEYDVSFPTGERVVQC